MTVFNGTSGANVFLGDNLDDDLVNGFGGNDNLSGLGGDDTINGGSGRDIINGGDDDDILSGGSGADTIDGGFGDNTVDGGSGSDRITGGADNDSLLGGSGADTINGGDGDDTLSGGAGNDILSGGAGDDTLSGGAGNDILTGGVGNNTFAYNSPNEGVDTITDFVIADDTIQASAAGFGGGLAVGVLPANQFNYTFQALGASTRFIYNPGTGDLFFDPDGTGGAGQVQLAVISGSPFINNSDIVVV